MKIRLLFTSCAILLCSQVQAYEVKEGSRHLALQGDFVTGGNLGIGLAYYTEKAEIGATFSGKINNSSEETGIFTPNVFAGLRKNITHHTYFTYGVDVGTTVGHVLGETINGALNVGPYISLEQLLTPNLLLSGWISPYTYQYEKIDNVSTSTNYFFSTGGVALSYFF